MINDNYRPHIGRELFLAISTCLVALSGILFLLFRVHAPTAPGIRGYRLVPILKSQTYFNLADKVTYDEECYRVYVTYTDGQTDYFDLLYCQSEQRAFLWIPSDRTFAVRGTSAWSPSDAVDQYLAGRIAPPPPDPPGLPSRWYQGSIG